ncbi:ParB/RepB/Spo0J family partition protein [Stenotrophomonas maltophilia]|uniref:ParB/RepB/Spo0J family partition protein n=1 Tax=Stenotrophomonas maltophilia TaxID=40324 RepID=UPI002ACD0C10|nr:ParB/RepB/Spo0J family partition protein [Stenotrophomonas maltophilia]MDZ5815068.1 ParB/RepB/Spo0J family partition protein [Stenotrophomonas maltophilia]
MNEQSTVIQVPLSQLRLSPRNARKKRTKASIEAMAATLKAHGQLQNLLVTTTDTQDVYAVAAGGTRLAGFELLQLRGEVQSDHMVDCKVVDSEDAAEISTAENTLREAMHPADQFRAFHKMIEEGRSLHDVATHFSIAESVVTQRLKLANVAPDLFTLYEQEEMSLEQLQALALTDDHDAQRRAWFGKKGDVVTHDWQRRPSEIRKRITSKEAGPDNPLVQFVGADSYEAAGGAVRRDMFQDDVYFADSKLLERLAKEKIEAIAENERSAGWAWVETHLQMDYSASSRYARGPFEPKRRQVTAEDKARLGVIEARLAEIEAVSAEDPSWDLEQLSAEASQLEAEQQLLEDGRDVWTDEAKAKTGVLIYVDRHHGLRIERGSLLPGQRISAGRVAGKGKQAGPKKAALSQDMVQRLEMHRAAALREHIAARPAAALQLLLTHLVTRVIIGSHYDSTLDIAPRNQHKDAKGLIDSKFGDLGKAAARSALDGRVDAWKAAGLPAKIADVPKWIEGLTELQRLDLLALVTALTLNTNAGDRGSQLAGRFEVDMTAWWHPTAETFIGVVPKALLAEAVAEVAGKEQGEALLSMKKDAAVATASKTLAGSGWLPKPLRGAGYKLGASVNASPSPAKAAGKLASKGAKKTGARKVAKATGRSTKAKSAPVAAAKTSAAKGGKK